MSPGAPLPHRLSWRRMPIHFAWQLALNSVIALILWGGSPARRLDVQMVYSQAIGLTIWAIINVGAILIDRDSPIGWPRGGKGAALVVTGIVAGALLGTWVGDRYAGLDSWGRITRRGESFFFVFGLTFVVGGVISYFYFVRGKSAYLAAQLEATQRQAAEARLKLLQSQLEPHMLFNTLANLRALIGVDPPAAQQMVDRMNDYLRATLSASRATLHPLSAEFERLRDYLDLMAIRMGPRLRHELNLPDALRALPVPTLLLQPLVENAIRHGLEPKLAGGAITVRAARDGAGDLLLEVADTGVGYPPDAHDSIANGRGFGLTQVKERVTSAYGGLGRVEVQSQPGAGTTVRITLPLAPDTSSRPEHGGNTPA